MAGKAIFSIHWDNYSDFFTNDQKDIYFTENYLKLCENAQDKAECFIYTEQDKIFLFPYLKRKIEDYGKQFYDFETAYGYGGPLSNTDDVLFNSRAVNSFYFSAREAGIVAGFTRFHPLLLNFQLFHDKPGISFNRHTIAINLNLTEAEILNNQINQKQRNCIRKAKKLGLVYIADENLDYLEDFKRIYAQTMERLGAEEFYYFADNYFNHLKNLKENIFLALVLLEDKIISAALIFKFNQFGHYHLSGSIEDYKEYNPNSLLLYETALFLKSKAVSLFHLGGGTDSSQDNNLYLFKKKFSKQQYPFYTGKIIFDEKKYAEVCCLWEKKSDGKREPAKNYFLKYRY